MNKKIRLNLSLEGLNNAFHDYLLIFTFTTDTSTYIRIVIQITGNIYMLSLRKAWGKHQSRSVMKYVYFLQYSSKFCILAPIAQAVMLRLLPLLPQLFCTQKYLLFTLWVMLSRKLFRDKLASAFMSEIAIGTVWISSSISLIEYILKVAPTTRCVIGHFRSSNQSFYCNFRQIKQLKIVAISWTEKIGGCFRNYYYYL